MRTLLIGLDAACRPVLDRVFAADAAPTLAGLFDESASGPLTSQVPPWTPSAWPSLYTGVNPGRHGVFGFLSFDGYDWDVVNAADVREWTLFELLDYHGLGSVVVNAPVTHPPPGIDGAVVPGYTAPEDPDCHPPGLLSELRDELGAYRVYADSDGSSAGQGGDQERASIDAYRDLAASRGRAFRYLVDRFDPAFGFVQFQGTDTVFHERPGDWAAVRAVYGAVDDAVTSILSDCDPDVVIVASDHGIGPIDGYGVRVNDFLREQGYVETESGAGGMPSWGAVGAGGRDDGRPADGAGVLATALSAAGRVGLTSQRIGAALDRVGLQEVVLEYVPLDLVRAASERVDFRRSRAYMRSRIELGVRINLDGREPEGVVPADEYDRIRADLVDLFEGLQTPDGERVFETVAPREAVFDGPYVDEAPDLLLVPADYDHYLSANLRGDPLVPEPREPWNHKLDGIVAVAGERIDIATGGGIGTASGEGGDAATIGDAAATEVIDDAHLLDVAPTVLATLGVPAGDHMEGDVLPPVDPVGTADYPECDAGAAVENGEAAVETADRAVERRLSELGYIE